jgi:hypothetical protein
MSVLGTLKSLFGFNEENQNDISSFQDAGMTLDEDPPKNTPQQPVDNRIMGGGSGDGSAMHEFKNAQPTQPKTIGELNDLLLGYKISYDEYAKQVKDLFPNTIGAERLGGQTTGQSTIGNQTAGTAGQGAQGIQTTGTQTGNQTGTQTTGTQTTGTQTTGTQTTGTQTTGGEIGVSNTRGGGTAPPPGATPGIVGSGGINFGAGSEFVRVMPGQVVETTDKKGVKSKSIEDLIEIGGSGFDDDVYARKLRRQAAMPDLKNEDYYPNEPFSESRTAWGDPIFSGAGAQFPMAAYDAQRKARAQAELDEAKRDIMQLKIPEIKTGAYYNAIRSGFTQQVKDIVNDAVTRAGGNYQKAKRILDQEGKLALAQSEWQGTAKMIDEKADVATAYLKKVRENPGDLYFPFEGVTATTDFLNGMNEFANGRITPAQLNELDKRMVSADKWEKFKQENMGKLKPTEYIPTSEQLKNSTPEDREAFKAVQLDLGEDKAPDFNTWLYTQKYTEAALPQVMNGIVQPFFDQEKTAAEQLVLPGEKLEDAKLRVARGIADLFGRQYSQGTVTQNRKSDTRINIDNSQPTKKTFYQSIDEKKGKIMSEAMKAKPTNVAQAKQVAEQIYGGGTADDFFFGVRAFDWPSINMSIASMPYSELYEPQIPNEKVYFHKVNRKNAGIPETNTTAKNLKVQGVVNAFISKNKDGSIRTFSNEDMVNSPLTADYKPYMIQIVTDEKYETSGSDFDPNDTKAILESLKSAKKSPATSGIYYRFIPLDKSTATTLDQKADLSSQFTGGTKQTNVTAEVKEDF